jgi:KDO2-lipid IV(A) lauroyltransferase
VPDQEVLGRRKGLAAWLEYVLTRALVRLAAALPKGLREGLIRALAWLMHALDRRHSRAAAEYLAQALGPMSPEESRRRVRRAWQHLLRLTIAAERFARDVPPELFPQRTQLEMCPAAAAIARAGRPCVIIGAHVGDWENGVALLPHLGFSPLYAISKPPSNHYLARHAQALRRSRGIRLLPRRGAMEFVPAVIRGGGSVAMLLDQRARVKPVLAPLFGRMATADRSAGVLLRRLKAPLVIVAVYADERPGHYRVVFPAVIEPEELTGASPEAIAERINAELERLIRACPDQYFWLHDRYRGAPPEG